MKDHKKNIREIQERVFQEAEEKRLRLEKEQLEQNNHKEK
jgi:hypothetical protein